MSNIKKFKCDLCEYATDRKYNLYTIHMRKHTEHTIEHKYACDACNMTFRCKSNLSGHLKTLKHKKNLAANCPEAFTTTETRYNDIIIKTKKQIDHTKSHLYLKKISVTKPKKKQKDDDDDEPKPKSKRTQPISRALFKDAAELSESQISDLVDLFKQFAKDKIDLNDFYDADYYQDNPEPEAEYNDILDAIKDEDFKLF